MKKFNKYFGGEYLKYWYTAFVIIVLLMLLISYNNRSVDKYELYIFDNNGKLVEKTIITKEEYKNLEGKLPITKALKPIKKFSFLP
ncbi:hypothetical protein OWM07_08885 [Deferribacter thermophilus]|uniref:hypothetical protein n=1 Tax=Deferribacter thermophilus TaxID=53573 RepID=UPI003C14E700